MYTNVSAEFLTALQRPSRHFAARFKDNGTVVDLEVKHIKAHFGSCGAGSLAVGCAFSSYIEVTANRTDILLEGKELFLEIGLLLPDDSYEYVPFGYWTVQKPTKTKDSMSFQAVDRMNGSFNAEYETELTYPATVAAVLSEFTTKTGITVHCSLQTSTVMIAAPIVGTQRNALSIIAATLLGNAWIDRNGEIQIATIGGGTVVEVNYDYVKTQPEMDEEPTVIDGVKVYTVEGQTDTWIERGTGNQVTVSDVYMTDANLDIVKNNVIGLTYGGGTVSFMGNPLLDPSDIIKFRGGIEMEEYMLVTETNTNIVSDSGDDLAALAYESYEVPCMDIVQDFDGGLLTTVTATGQFEDTESTIAPAPMASELARQASAISSAQQTADNAVVLANGKNKIFYQDAEPTTGMSVGDMWFDTNGGNAIYEYKSTGWVLRQLGQGSLAANSVTALEINVATLSAITANIGEVTAGVLKSSDYSYTSGTYTTAGMIIDLNNKVIRATNAAILGDGKIYVQGGEIGGFAVDSTSIHTINVPITSNAESSLGISSGTFTRTIGGVSRGNLKMAIADAFGVAKDGLLYSAKGVVVDSALSNNSVYYSGKIEVDVVGEEIGYIRGAKIVGDTQTTLYLVATDVLSMSCGENAFLRGNTLYLTGTSGTINMGADGRSVTVLLNGGGAGASGAILGFRYPGSSSTMTSSIQETSAGVFTVTASLNLTGNLVVGSTSDTVARNVTVRNSLGSAALAVGTDGAHGLWSNTKGGFLLYATKDDSTTNNRVYIPRPLTVSGELVAKDYSGSSRQIITSYATDGQRVSAFGAAGAQTLFVGGQWSVAGTTYSTKTITVSSSDIRLKTNIEDADIEALPIVNRMRVRAFDWKDGRKDIHQSIGVVADELEEIDRRLSVGGGYAEDGSIIYKSVDTFYLCGYLLKAIQELSAEVNALKGVA